MRFEKSACIEPLYSEIPFLERFKAAKNDGFEYVEFWYWTNKDIDAVKRAAEDAGIGISGFNGDEHYSLIDPAQKDDYMDYIKKSLDVAVKLNAKSITIHSNALDDKGYVENEYLELSDTVKLCNMYELLMKCAKLGEDSGILLNLEPLNITTDHMGNYLAHTQMAAEMTRLINSPKLKVLYDVYHMQLNEGSLCDTIKKYGDQFGHIHVADAPGRHEPGTGEINYSKIFECLDEIGYNGRIGFELIPKTTTAEAVKAIMKY